MQRGLKRGADTTTEVMDENTAKIEHLAGDPTTEEEIDAKYPGSVKVSCGAGSVKWKAVFTKIPDTGAQLYLLGEDVVVPSGVPLCGIGSGAWKSDQEAKEVMDNPVVCVWGRLLVL